MELFDLEIPIRSTGLDATRQDFRALEQAGTESAKRVETALARTAPPASVAAGFTRTAASATQATAAVDGVGRAATRSAASDASLAAEQQRVAVGLQDIAKDILQAKAAFDAGTLSADEMGVALATARQQAVALKGGLALPSAQAEAFRVIMASTVPALAAADGAMKLIAADVKLAAAAFKAGTISAEDYAVALQTARAQAIAASQGTQLAGSELTAFSGILRQTEQSSGRARQGLGTMRSSMLSLAASMVGTRSSLSSVAGALLLFTGGSALAAGVAAGVLAIVAVYEKLTQTTRLAREEQEKLNEQVRRAREDAERADDPTIALQEKTKANLTAQLALLEQLRLARIGTPVGQPGGDVRFVVDQDKIDRLGQQLDALKRDAGQIAKDYTASVKEMQKGALDNLTALVAAGTATTKEEGILRAELAKSKAALAAMTEAQRATNEGRARVAALTERITTIEGAFAKQTKASAKETADAAKSMREQVDALVDLQTLEGPTVARWQMLLDEAAKLREELDRGNLTLAERRDALEQLQRIQASVDFGTPQIERVQSRGPDLRRLPPLTLDQPVAIPGGADSLFGRMVAQIEAGGKSAEDAIQAVHDKLAAAAANMSQGIADALVSAFSGNTDFGAGMLKALGAMVIQFGVAVIGIGNLMQEALKALSSLNPIAAIAAGAALVALGALISSAAKSSFTPRGASGASLQPINQTFTISSGSRTAPVAQTEAKASALRTTPVTLTVNHFGGRDPAFGRWLGDQLSAAQARGAA